MSFAEIQYRCKELLKRSISRFYIPNLIENLEKKETLPKLPGVTDGLSYLKNNNQLIQEWKNLTKPITTKRFQFLGVQWPHYKTNNIWHLDPITKKHWPFNTYCFHINYRNTKEYGDVKYILELNRLQYLQPLAVLAKIEKDEDLSKYCLNEIESWIDHNPPFKGINWASGIELACRVVSIIVVISLINDILLTPQQKIKIHKTLALHGYWLMRYPSRYSSANNHLVAEAGALYLLGKLCPYLPQAKRWRVYGRNTLIEEVTKQIYSDGVGAEQSPTYLAFTLEWLLLCGMVGQRLGDDFPGHFWQRIEKAGEFIRWLTDKNGNQPRIGDDDEGQIFYSYYENKLYVTSILATLAKVTQRQDIAPPVKTVHLREVFFGKSIYSFNVICGVKCFQTGGYTVSRSILNNKEIILSIDHGPLGYLSIAAHGHADTLAIWLHIDGVPVIVDAGTFLYHSGDNWREYMRNTPAHNTLSINGKSSSNSSSAFNWSTKAKASLLVLPENQNQWKLEAEHDGYVKPFGLKHRRCVEKYDETTFAISDSLDGTHDTLLIEIGFLLHPDLEIKKHNSYWVVSKNNHPLLQIELTSNNLKQSVQYGETGPYRGWYSEAFGRKTKTSRLVFSDTIYTNLSFRVTLKLRI